MIIDTSVDNKIITISDARAVGGCVPGWKNYLENNGFDWKDAVKNGILADKILATDDIMAIKVVEYVYSKGDIDAD